MALLNRFSKLNDRGETGIFTFIVTKSVTRDFHRDATTKDFCFGYHRWAISFQRPNEKVLGVHLLLRNPSPNSSCLVDFTLTLLNREHFSQNEVYTKRQAKFTITNSMQGVARWIQMSDLVERHFSNETGEFLFELSLSNMTTIFECDIQLSPTILTQYKSMLQHPSSQQQTAAQLLANNNTNANETTTTGQLKGHSAGSRQQQPANGNNNNNRKNSELINLETNYFTFGAFDWSLTIVPLVIPSQQQQHANKQENSSASSSSSSNNNSSNLLTPNKQLSNSSLSIASNSSQQQASGSKKSVQPQQQQPGQPVEPVCRVYLNRLNGFDCLCRVKYRVILGHHQAGSPHPAEFVDSRLLDQISDSGGRIRGHQFRHTNILKLISLRSAQQQQQQQPPQMPFKQQQSNHHHHHHHQQQQQQHNQNHSASSLDLRVHIEMFCANTVSEAHVAIQRKPNEAQVSNCSDRNKQAWCVESETENENVRLKLFFMDLQSVPRNHIRYISWIAYIVRRDSKSGAMKESIAVRNSPHSNYYLQDGIDMGTLMDTDIKTKELNNSPKAYLEGNQLTVHIEWVDSLLLFSHLYNNYDSLATIQRHQIRRELSALQQEYELLERKYLQNRRALNQLLDSGGSAAAGSQPESLQSSANNEQPNVTTGSQRILSQQQQHGSTARKVSLAISEQAAHWAQGSASALEGSAPAVAAAASAPTIGQQISLGAGQANNNQQHNRRTPPMSLDERLKFSSSTPPSRSHNQQQMAAGLDQRTLTSRLSDSPTHQRLLEQMKLGGAGSAAGSNRRRLPQQPALGKIQAQEMRQLVSPDLLAGQQQQRGSTVSLESCLISEMSSSSPPPLIQSGLAGFGSPVKLNSLAGLDNNLHQIGADQPTQSGQRAPMSAAPELDHHRYLPAASLQAQMLENCPRFGTAATAAAAAAAAAAATATVTAQLMASQAECEQVDRYYHAPLGQARPLDPPYGRQLNTGRPSSGAPTGRGGSPLLYERLMLARQPISDQQNNTDNLDLELEMEALYVGEPGSMAPAQSLRRLVDQCDELAPEARQEANHYHHRHDQQQVGGLVAEAIARHQAASFAVAAAAADQQFERLAHYGHHYEQNRL